MTAKVASPASPAEDLACRGPLKAKRLLYTEDQLSFTRKVLQTPTKQGHSVVCVSFIWLLMLLDLPVISTFALVFTFYLLYSCSFVDDFHWIAWVCCLCKAYVFPSCQSAEVYIQPVSGEACLVKLYLVYLLTQPSLKPQLVAKSPH